MTRKLHPVKYAANALSLSIWTLRSWAYAGKVASHKVGNRLMISEDELNRIIAETERPRLEGK